MKREKMGTANTFFHDRLNITLWVFVFMCGACVRCLAAGHFFEWDVHDMFWSPDGMEDSVMAINGQFPGPNITATAGDEVHVRLRNKLTTEGVVIHWHGIRQKGTPWADGTASISQCVINPGETFDYNFTVDRAGTYFYHGHYGMQRSAGLYGSLIVKEAKKEPLDHYDDEFSLLLSDWWHESVHHQELGLSSNPFRWIGEPQTILINGRGQYNCSFDAHTNASLSKCNLTKAREQHWDPYVLNVHPNKSYRLRIASVTSLASLNMAIGGHKMWVVEADGNYVQPFETVDLDIYSGQSYSILFKTNQDPTKNYWISFGVRGRKPATPQGLAIVRYNQNPQLQLPASPPPVTPRWDDYDHSRAFSNKIRGLKGITPKVPEKSDRRIFLLNTQNEINGYKKWAINNISLTLPPTPYLGSIRFRLGGYDKSPPPENFPADYDVMKPPKNRNTSTGNGVYVLGYRSVVDIILQNANALSENVSEIHPWHLHGHDFWVLGYGEGKFKEGVDDKKFNLENPPYRNTEIIFPYGWTALRFVADNPGVWAFHCHIEPHLHMGMGVIFAEGMTHVAKIPKQGLACGLTGKKFMKNSHLGD